MKHCYIFWHVIAPIGTLAREVEILGCLIGTLECKNKKLICFWHFDTQARRHVNLANLPWFSHPARESLMAFMNTISTTIKYSSVYSKQFFSRSSLNSRQNFTENLLTVQRYYTFAPITHSGVKKVSFIQKRLGTTYLRKPHPLGRT